MQRRRLSAEPSQGLCDQRCILDDTGAQVRGEATRLAETGHNDETDAWSPSRNQDVDQTPKTSGPDAAAEAWERRSKAGTGRGGRLGSRLSGPGGQLGRRGARRRALMR